MISPELFLLELEQLGINFITGVPDSLLKDFCQHVQDCYPPERHLIAANEGSAVAIAAGTQIASGKTPLVYLQNSGLGNTINPLLSLADKEVYSIPMLLLIGWRGEPGCKDEPQHVKQGEVTIPMLKAMSVPYFIIDSNFEITKKTLKESLKLAEKSQSPVVLLARKGIFSSITNKKNYSLKNEYKNLISREEAISIILASFPSNTLFVSTTGHISRELYELRCNLEQSHERDFLTVGSMGHSSQIALGLSLIEKDLPIVCLDGDGAMIMHMGGLTSIGSFGSRKLNHILINNSVHDSVGGQPTVGFKISSTKIAKGSLYNNVLGPVSDPAEIRKIAQEAYRLDGPNFIEIRVRPGARSNLIRPKESPLFNKRLFINKIRNK